MAQVALPIAPTEHRCSPSKMDQILANDYSEGLISRDLIEDDNVEASNDESANVIESLGVPNESKKQCMLGKLN